MCWIASCLQTTGYRLGRVSPGESGNSRKGQMVGTEIQYILKSCGPSGHVTVCFIHTNINKNTLPFANKPPNMPH